MNKKICIIGAAGLMLVRAARSLPYRFTIKSSSSRYNFPSEYLFKPFIIKEKKED